MITPRTTRLRRVPDLRAFQRVLVSLVAGERARAAAVIVPTRGAAEQLRRTIETVALADSGRAVLLPELLTRTDFYARLHQRLPSAPPLLTEFDREVLFRRAAAAVSDRMGRAPFPLRPRLIVAILRFYDELRRFGGTVDSFDRLITSSLEPSAEIDRGADRMLRQTGFFSAAFAEFERLVADSGSVDEHALRALLLQEPVVPPLRQVVIAVADQAGDPHGLWPADFDLLSRMPGLELIEVVATERLLATGLLERLHQQFPGLDESRAASGSAPPVLVVPEPPPGTETIPWTVSRDREEELADAARWVAHTLPPEVPLDQVSVIYQRPLPYLYLARHVLGSARLPFQAVDALPLAAEPIAAGLDLVFTFYLAEAARAAVVHLLGSPQWSFADLSGGQAVDEEPRGTWADAVAALDRLLRELKYLGGWERLGTLSAEAGERERGQDRRASLWRRAAPALRAAGTLAAELRDAFDAPAASGQLRALREFVLRHERRAGGGSEATSGHLRSRTAILGALRQLEEAHARHDDRRLDPADLIGTIRRWIEGQTFSPAFGTSGILLLDARAAEFARVSHARIVGAVDSDWPERPSRNIFYPTSLLAQLGWPAELSRLSAARARFQDLLHLPDTAVGVSTFTLEDDALVAPSALLDELPASGLAIQRTVTGGSGRIFTYEALAESPVVASAATGEAARWLALREARAAASEVPRGATSPRPPTVYAVSSLERYLECPFKYFAQQILRLDEERPEESGLTPQERGQFLHAVFEEFFTRWQERGRRGMTPDNLGDALALFEEIAEAALETLPEGDRALERTYLLGSAAAPGLAERAFAFEIEHGVEVVDRLLEHPLEGVFTFAGPDGRQDVRLRAKADRIDLLADDTLRVIDYKLGKAPKPGRALQLPVYGVCAEQQLSGHLGRSWRLARAGYVAFRERNAFVPLGGAANNLEKALADGQARLVQSVNAIEAGRFPVQPDEPWLCTRCGYAVVCRKDYIGDE